MKKHKPKSVEINWGEPEAFALVPETSLDHERIQRERDQREKDRRESEQQQSQFNYDHSTGSV